MSKVTINFADVPDYEAIPDGAYPVIIESVELRNSQSSEWPFLNWSLSITEGQYQNRKLWLITSLSPKSLWNLKGVFDGLGVLAESMELEIDDATQMLINPQLAGKAAVALTKGEMYEGKLRSRVTDLQPIAPAPQAATALAATTVQRPTVQMSGAKPAAAAARVLK